MILHVFFITLGVALCWVLLFPVIYFILYCALTVLAVLVFGVAVKLAIDLHSFRLLTVIVLTSAFGWAWHVHRAAIKRAFVAIGPWLVNGALLTVFGLLLRLILVR